MTSLQRIVSTTVVVCRHLDESVRVLRNMELTDEADALSDAAARIETVGRQLLSMIQGADND